MTFPKREIPYAAVMKYKLNLQKLTTRLAFVRSPL